MAPNSNKNNLECVTPGAFASHMACVRSLRGASATKQSRPVEIASLSLAMTAKRFSDGIALAVLQTYYAGLAGTVQLHEANQLPVHTLT